MAKITQPTRHADGTPCPEGTQRLPKTFNACCPEFTARTLACYFDVRYEWWAQHGNWFIVISEFAGGGGIAMAHCPHCGTELKSSGKSGRWIEVPRR